MVTTRSMSSSQKIESKNLKFATRSTRKKLESKNPARSTTKTAAQRKRETTKEKLLEEAFNHFLKKELFESMYPDVNIRQKMSYPFGPPEEFKKFEYLGRAEWKSYSESTKTCYLKRLKTIEARNRAMRKMESGEKLTDKNEKAEFKRMLDAAFIYFWFGSVEKGYRKDKNEAEIREESHKMMNAASLKWKSMTFEEKAPYFHPKWFEEYACL